MFLGRYDYGIDGKGRVSIPAKFREELAHDQRLVLARDEGCIAGHPYQEWLEIKDEISKQGSQGPAARNFVRLYFAGATEAAIDRLGRVLIPTTLRQAAGIKKDVVIIGVNRRIEIWAKEAWEELERNPNPNGEPVGDIFSATGR